VSEALILAQLATINAKLDILLSGGGTAAQASGGARPAASADGAVASDSDLDDSRGYGDPQIVYDPREKYWKGASYIGRKFSQVPDPEYLEATAKYLDACAYMAEQDGDETKRKGAGYKRKDAARARGWARRLRTGGAPVAAPRAAAPAQKPSEWETSTDYTTNDDTIPF